MKKKLKLLYEHLLVNIKDDVMQELELKFLELEIKNEKLEKPMTSKEICQHYKISSSTLERYIRNGLKFKNSGKKSKRLFTKNDFNNFLNERNKN